jgi:hypothetical protein
MRELQIASALCLLLAGCSGDAVRGNSDLKPDIAPMSRDAERQHIIEEGKSFCDRYKDDAACRAKTH